MTEPRLCSMTAGEMVRLVGAGALTRRELVEAHLERIAAHNGAIGAIVETRGEAALAEAAAADRDAADRSGLALDGVPVCIKDHFDVAGMKHTEGVRAMAQRVSTADEAAVARLRAAGRHRRWKVQPAGLSDPVEHGERPLRCHAQSPGPRADGRGLFGAAMPRRSRPAWQRSGSARITAGPSACRRRSAASTVSGPSAGRVPAVATLPPFDGPPTLDLMASIGPFARSVGDLWRAFEVLSGADPRDPATIDIPLRAQSNGSARRVARMCHQTGRARDAGDRSGARLDRRHPLAGRVRDRGRRNSRCGAGAGSLGGTRGHRAASQRDAGLARSDGRERSSAHRGNVRHLRPRPGCRPLYRRFHGTAPPSFAKRRPGWRATR